MHGVTTAIVAFIFFCVIFPERVRNKTQFYAGLGLICLIILLDALHVVVGREGFTRFTYFAMAFLQIAAILVMFIAAGGLSWRELADDMTNAYEVIRRGGEQKEVIIPLTGQQPPRKKPAAEAGSGESQVFTLDDDETPGAAPLTPAPAPRAPAPTRDDKIPLE